MLSGTQHPCHHIAVVKNGCPRDDLSAYTRIYPHPTQLDAFVAVCPNHLETHLVRCIDRKWEGTNNCSKSKRTFLHYFLSNCSRSTIHFEYSAQDPCKHLLVVSFLAKKCRASSEFLLLYQLFTYLMVLLTPWLVKLHSHSHSHSH